MNRLALIVASVAVLVACSFVDAAEKVANPEYKHWAPFKVGSSSELTGTKKMKGDAFRRVPPSTTKTTTKLVELTAEKAVVEKTVTYIRADNAFSPNVFRREIPATLDADKVDDEMGLPEGPGMSGHKNDVKKGEGNLTVAGKTLKCTWFEYNNYGGGVATAMKVWLCPEIPGGLVNSESHTRGMDESMQLTAFEIAK